MITTNAKEVARRIEEKRRKVEAQVRKEVERSAKDIRSMLYARTPVAPTFTAITTTSGRRTTPFTHTGGRARASFTNSPREAGDAIFKLNLSQFDATIGTNVPYFLFIEEGTRAHGPTTKKFLRFGLPSSGVIFAKWVRGIRPMKIVFRTRMTWSRVWPQRAKEAVRRGLM